jgi:hypothetical protein
LFDLKFKKKPFLRRIGRLSRLHPDIIAQIKSHEHMGHLIQVFDGLNVEQLVSIKSFYFTEKPLKYYVSASFQKELESLDPQVFYQAVTKKDLNKERQKDFILGVANILAYLPDKLISDEVDFLLAFTEYVNKENIFKFPPVTFLSPKVLNVGKINTAMTQAILQVAQELDNSDNFFFILDFCGQFNAYLDIPYQYSENTFFPICLEKMNHPFKGLKMELFDLNNFKNPGEFIPLSHLPEAAFRKGKVSKKFFFSIDPQDLLIESSIIEAICYVFGEL